MNSGTAANSEVVMAGDRNKIAFFLNLSKPVLEFHDGLKPVYFLLEVGLARFAGKARICSRAYSNSLCSDGRKTIAYWKCTTAFSLCHLVVP